jgi:hypothetical protein
MRTKSNLLLMMTPKYVHVMRWSKAASPHLNQRLLVDTNIL